MLGTPKGAEICVDWYKNNTKSVPLNTKKLTAGVPKSPRRLHAPSLWGNKGWGAVAEVLARDGVQLLGHSAVNAGLRSFSWGLQEHGEDGEKYRHERWVSGQVRVHCPRMYRVGRHVGIFESSRQLSGEEHVGQFALAVR